VVGVTPAVFAAGVLHFAHARQDTGGKTAGVTGRYHRG